MPDQNSTENRPFTEMKPERDRLSASRLSEIRSQYEQNFSVRDDAALVEPLEYHLYHLALYWSRSIGFCDLDRLDASGWVNSDLGACVAVGTEIVSEIIDAQPPCFEAWESYRTLTDAMLRNETRSIENVKAASKAFAHFLDLMGYVSWESWAPTPSSPIVRLPRK